MLFGWSTLTADSVLATTAETFRWGRQRASSVCTSIVTADQVLATMEETFSRPTEYLVHFVTHDRQIGRERAVAHELPLDGCEWNVENNNHLIYILLWQQT